MFEFIKRIFRSSKNSREKQAASQTQERNMLSLYEFFKQQKTKERIEEFLEVNCIAFSSFEAENTHDQF